MQPILGDQVTFESPLPVPMTAGATPRRLFSAEECARFLLNDWRGTRTKKYNAAVLACVAAMTGAADAEHAKRAVMAAFDEARLPAARPASSRSAGASRSVEAAKQAGAAAG